MRKKITVVFADAEKKVYKEHPLVNEHLQGVITKKSDGCYVKIKVAKGHSPTTMTKKVVPVIQVEDCKLLKMISGGAKSCPLVALVMSLGQHGRAVYGGEVIVPIAFLATPWTGADLENFGGGIKFGK